MFPDQFTNVVTTLGGTVSIPIQVHGKPVPTITLQKMMDGSWTSIQATRFRVNDTQISLSSAREADTGEYRLVLSNREHQSITYEFNITVEGEALLHDCFIRVYVTLGDNVLVCAFNCYFYMCVRVC